MKVTEGDICVLDERAEYSYIAQKPYKVLVLWNGVNNQPLVFFVPNLQSGWTIDYKTGYAERNET